MIGNARNIGSGFCKVCVCVCERGDMNMCLVPTKQEKGVRSSRTRVKNSCELPFGFWKLNPGPVEEQSVLMSHLSSPLS